VSTMIERVARAICAATDVTPENALGGPFFDAPDAPYYFGEPQQQAPRWKLYVPAARAAIAAMREPTPGMVEAGDDTAGTLAITHDYSAYGTWQDMIDAALGEKT
jgi:hypothetical protein